MVGLYILCSVYNRRVFLCFRFKQANSKGCFMQTKSWNGKGWADRERGVSSGVHTLPWHVNAFILTRIPVYPRKSVSGHFYAGDSRLLSSSLTVPQVIFFPSSYPSGQCGQDSFTFLRQETSELSTPLQSLFLHLWFTTGLQAHCHYLGHIMADL